MQPLPPFLHQAPLLVFLLGLCRERDITLVFHPVNENVHMICAHTEIIMPSLLIFIANKCSTFNQLSRGNAFKDKRVMFSVTQQALGGHPLKKIIPYGVEYGKTACFSNSKPSV